MSWASRRQFIILVTLFLLALSVLMYVLYRVFFNVAPTCSDGKRNQDELGIDCSGSCARVCEELVRPIATEWARLFPVENTYTIVGVFENSNINSYATKVPYRYKLYDEKGILVSEGNGTTFANARERFAVVIPGIIANSERPPRVFFEVEGPITWLEEKRDAESIPVLRADGFTYSDDGGRTRIRVQVKNDSYVRAENVAVPVVLYGEDGIAFAASETVLDAIEPQGTATLYYSWPFPLSAGPAKVDIFPRVAP